MSTSAHDEIYPRGEGPFRYRIYRLRAGVLDVISATETAAGIGLGIVAGHEEGEWEGDDRVGVLDTATEKHWYQDCTDPRTSCERCTTNKADLKGTWIVSPFTGGRGRRDLQVGDHVESAVSGHGTPAVRGTITSIHRDVATIRLDTPIRSRVKAKRSLKHLRVVGDGG